MSEPYKARTELPMGRPILVQSACAGVQDISRTPVGDGLRMIFELLSIACANPEETARLFNEFCSLSSFPAVVKHINIDRSAIFINIESNGDTPYLATNVREFSRDGVMAIIGYLDAARDYGLGHSEIVEDLVERHLCDGETAWWFVMNLPD